MQVPARRYAPVLAATAAILTCLISTAPAKASLGARQTSINADVSRLKARLRATASADYTESDLTGDGGAITREFTNGSGTVFAVSWSGPVRPDLRQLFGDYFPRLQADTHARTRVRRPLRADDVDFIVRTGGHPGAMWGFAVLPGEMPQSFPMEVLQ